ncbi:PREDICTED: RNA cytidine acetyltransferase 2 [Camelina sativa]|uniref:RNA cytidine acetyltransferase n=1 Tax=Camelina sativa TaxID=90675 RepID=A0ABM0YR90_CAMSA|nr:PREDICTED: RNA cytidine acetyltransferase 2 [Camelina sativa]
MRKKVDERIRTLIENGVKLRHRSMFVIIGDKSRDQIVNLHHMLSKAVIKCNPSILWCYKDKLDISSHKQKRSKQLKRLRERGQLDPEKLDAFSRLLDVGRVTHCLYKDSERILGNTFGMCILQDFEALTPNLLARTIETVEGGGLVVLILRSLTSLTSLCTMVMDVHDRFRTESHSEAAGRFNERFLLSLASCKACVVMDDELNILPLSSHIRSITQVPTEKDSEGLSEAERDLKSLKDELSDDFPVGPLIKKCCTLDQGKAVISFFDAILDKALRSIVALIASRGRGKSAALGLAVAGAVAAGYSNIYITAPSPDNLRTFFEFVCKGFDALEYKEHLDYDVVKSANPDFKKAIVRINIYKQHRQTIQYIQPHEHEKLSQVELLVIDEAAAIPLPVVKSLLGPYLVFLSSTVSGYEGTGRSLSLKLLQQLDEQSRAPATGIDGSLSGFLFKKIELNESIRYASGDPIESWLNGLLCLDVATCLPNPARHPSPSQCDLYYVNRDTLFSFHKDSELFLQRMMALCVSSHYKNSPNDLQLLADAPAHHLFVLLGPVDESQNKLPDILCVIQVCLEGKISENSALQSLRDGHSPYGDQIPWKFCEQFRDTEFPGFSGARIVRIAVHPNAMKMGYGSAAVELLTRYFEGEIAPISEADDKVDVEQAPIRVTEAAEKVSMLEEQVKPRTNLPPLLVPLHERRPEKLHYIGVSFGLTLDLFRFWRKHNFAPFYVSQVPSAVTGEHTCMLLRPLKNDELVVNESDELGFFTPFYKDFKTRFSKLLSDKFKKMDYKLVMSVLNPKINFPEVDSSGNSSDGFLKTLDGILSPYDMERLRAYTKNLTDFNLVYDICKTLAHQYFEEKLPVSLSYVQASILLCLGLQEVEFSSIERQMQLERGQVHSLILKVARELYKYLNGVVGKEIESALPRLKERELEPHNVSVDDDIREGAKQVEEQMKEKIEGLMDSELQQYVIGDKEAEDLQHSKIFSSGIISVKSTKSENDNGFDKSTKKRSSDKRSSSSSKSKSFKKRRA